MCCAPCPHTSPSTALLASCTMRPVILWAVAVCSYSTGPASHLSVAFVVSKPLSQAPFGRGSVARGFTPLGFCRQGSPSPRVGLTLGSNRRKDCFCGVAAGLCVCVCVCACALCVWWCVFWCVRLSVYVLSCLGLCPVAINAHEHCGCDWVRRRGPGKPAACVL